MSPHGKNASKTLALTLGPHTKAAMGQRLWKVAKEPKAIATPTPSPFPNWGFKSNRSSVLTASSQSDRSEGSLHSHYGRCHRETRGHMKITLTIFKDEDTKDTVSYQSWRWDLTVYHQAGCWDHTLLPYAIQSLQGYPGELVRSSGMDITLDEVLTILDEHYNNNIKALDTLNQELFQLQMGKKETVSDWGVWLSRHLQVLAALFPECFPPDCVAKLKCDHFYGRLPKWLKAMVAYLKASPQEKTYSDYLQAVREAKKEDSMEPSQSQTADKTAKPKVTGFFSLQKLKGTQSLVKTPAVCLAHLEEENTEEDEEGHSNDPDSIEGITEEFMVCLARAMKDTQKEKKCCYCCSILNHFICDCPWVKASRTESNLNWKEGTVWKKGAWAPQTKVTSPMMPPEGAPKA